MAGETHCELLRQGVRVIARGNCARNDAGPEGLTAFPTSLHVPTTQGLRADSSAPQPEARESCSPWQLRQEDVVLVVGSDGVFDVLSDAEAGYLSLIEVPNSGIRVNEPGAGAEPKHAQPARSLGEIKALLNQDLVPGTPELLG